MVPIPASNSPSASPSASPPKVRPAGTRISGKVRLAVGAAGSAMGNLSREVCQRYCCSMRALQPLRGQMGRGRLRFTPIALLWSP